jgi:hypothetical protein
MILSTLCGTTPSDEQNSNFAHHRVWKNFFGRRHVGCNDIAVIFQYDAVIGRDNAGTIIIDYIKEQTAAAMLADISYLGFCFRSIGIPKFLKNKRFNNFHPKKTGLAPHCLHAYAITIEGAKKMLATTDVCGSSMDSQVAILANEKKLTFTFFNETNRYDWDFHVKQFAKYGVHWKNDEMGHNRDGLFPQVELDNTLPQYLDGTAAHDLGRAQSVFILYKQTWRYIPNVDIFLKLLGEAPKGSTKVMTTWQMQHYPEGEALTDKDVPVMQDLLNRSMFGTVAII